MINLTLLICTEINLLMYFLLPLPPAASKSGIRPRPIRPTIDKRETKEVNKSMALIEVEYVTKTIQRSLDWLTQKRGYRASFKE